MKQPPNLSPPALLLLTIALTFTTSLSKAQEDTPEEGSPFSTPNAPEPFSPTNNQPPNQASFLFEYFQLDHLTANKLLRQYAPRAANAQDLRDHLGDLVEAGDARLIETGWIRSGTGQRSKSESIREDIYATEFDPAELPRTIGDITMIESEVKVGEKKSTSVTNSVQNKSSTGAPTVAMTSANPTAFETRNIGFTIEIDPVIGASGKYVDINLAPEITHRLEDQYFVRPGFEHRANGIENMSMPLFYRVQTTTALAALPGNYSLLAFHTPHDNPDERIIVLMKASVFGAQ